MRGYTCGLTREGCVNYVGWRVSSSSSPSSTARGRAAAGGRLSIVLAPGKKGREKGFRDRGHRWPNLIHHQARVK